MAFASLNKSGGVGAVSNFFRQAVKKVSGAVLKGPRTSGGNKVQFNGRF